MVRPHLRFTEREERQPRATEPAQNVSLPDELRSHRFGRCLRGLQGKKFEDPKGTHSLRGNIPVNAETEQQGAYLT